MCAEKGGVCWGGFGHRCLRVPTLGFCPRGPLPSCLHRRGHPAMFSRFRSQISFGGVILRSPGRNRGDMRSRGLWKRREPAALIQAAPRARFLVVVVLHPAFCCRHRSRAAVPRGLSQTLLLSAHSSYRLVFAFSVLQTCANGVCCPEAGTQVGLYGTPGAPIAPPR